MRLKTFTAPTMQEAMQMVRDALGDDAIIVATRQKRKPACVVRITAAVEESALGEPALAELGLDEWTGDAPNPEPSDPYPEAPDPNPGPGPGNGVDGVDAVGAVLQVLEAHGTPAALAIRLAAAARALSIDDPTMALAAALDDGFRFAPLPESGFDQPLMLVGPPGVGKTVTVAKLAARAILKGQPVRVLTTDTVRPGGITQLSSFLRLMGIDLEVVDEPMALARAMAAPPHDRLILIDSAGVNPFDGPDMAELEALIMAADAEPVLVLNGGTDAVDAAETAVAFAALGVTRLVVTRMDMARRLGGLLAAADAGRMRFANASVTPSVGKGLTSINPVSLARLLMPTAASAKAQVRLKESVS